jgi:hypothetical protein
MDRELKILADILALALDDQPGVAASSLEAIKQRARQGGVTGGALKAAFQSLSAAPPAREDTTLWRARIEALQSQVAAAERLKLEADHLHAAGLRRSRLTALATGLLAGGAIAVLLQALL